MFPDDRTRTKFFDFIVPVIPVINWSNSLQKLTDKLDYAGFKIEHRFITSVTLYIDDMRVLKNIFNELMLYKESLTIPEERQTKLLAMIAYKNIYPNDFAALHEEEGIVYDAFSNTQTVRNEFATDLDDQIILKKQQLIDIQAMVPHTIKELRAIYIQGIIDELIDFRYFYLDYIENKYSELQEEEIFKRLVSAKDIRYVNTRNQTVVGQYKFSAIEAKVYPGISYEEREKLVQQKSKETIVNLNLELKKLLADRTQINSYSLTDIIKLKPQRLYRPNLSLPHLLFLSRQYR